jgi:hypothetical protein
MGGDDEFPVNPNDLPANYFWEDPEASNVGQSPFIVGGGSDYDRRGETIGESPYKDLPEFKTGYTNPEGNLEKDYVVGDRGQIIDSGGNVVRDGSGISANLGAFDQFKNALSKLFGSSYTGKDGSGISGLLGNLGDVFGSKVGMAGLLALLSYLDRQKGKPATGGGTAMGYTPPAPAAPGRVVQGRYGPLMQYAGGGVVQMEDGGFVMTKRAVDGAGGPDGIRQLIPAARMIRGPGTGTSDSIQAVIKGRGGDTPAAVSNGEAYVPKREVDRLGGAQRMYGMMRQLTKKAR